MKHVVVSFALFIGAYAFADNHQCIQNNSDYIYGGGRALVCDGGTRAQLLLSHEEALEGGSMMDLSSSTLEAGLEEFLTSRVAPHSSTLADFYRDYYANSFNTNRHFVAGQTFPLIECEKVIVPVGCTVEQLGIRNGSTSQIFVNQDIWNLLSVEDQVWYVLSESYGIDDSNKHDPTTRRLVRGLGAESYQLESIRAMLSSMGPSSDPKNNIIIPNRLVFRTDFKIVSNEVNSNFGPLQTSTKELSLLGESYDWIDVRESSITIQSKPFITKGKVYFYKNGDVCSAELRTNTPASLDLAVGGSMFIVNPTRLVFDHDGKVVTQGGTSTPISSEEDSRSYCLKNY